MLPVLLPGCQMDLRKLLTLTDESQQYGNIEETSVIARTPRTCLNIWAGDHRQTPGGLKNTVECRMFRQKLLQRPLALGCGTEYVQPHELHRILSQYLDGPCDSPSHKLKLLLDDLQLRSCGAKFLMTKRSGWTPACVLLALPFSGSP